MDYQKLRDKRFAANRDLVNFLQTIVSIDNGEQRFSQILRNYGFVEQVDGIWIDEFYIEPSELLERVKAEYLKINGSLNNV